MHGGFWLCVDGSSSKKAEIAMNETQLKLQENSAQKQERNVAREQEKDLIWETPRMEDVSEQVTAQPYIRFT
jgi:transcriptional regulator with AAA-type ATPase domain